MMQTALGGPSEDGLPPRRAGSSGATREASSTTGRSLTRAMTAPASPSFPNAVPAGTHDCPCATVVSRSLSPEVALPGRHIPPSCRDVLVEQLGHGDGRVGLASRCGLREQPAELDLRGPFGPACLAGPDLPVGDRVSLRRSWHASSRPRVARCQLQNVTVGGRGLISGGYGRRATWSIWIIRRSSSSWRRRCTARPSGAVDPATRTGTTLAAGPVR